MPATLRIKAIYIREKDRPLTLREIVQISESEGMNILNSDKPALALEYFKSRFGGHVVVIAER